MRTIEYTPTLKITNMGHLSSGTGSKFLLVCESHKPDEFIAKAWKRKLPKSLEKGEAIVTF